MYEKLILPNGLRIVHEKMPHVRSAAVGVWIGVGSRYEKPSENGAAHFIEHMLFKGTSKHTAGELAEIMDGIGGQINAFTTRESTCFYARVLDTHLDTAINLLGEMFFESRFSEEDVESERGVILEEIDMYDDTPEDLVVEKLIKKCFPGALGRPILGTQKSLGTMTGESLRGFKEENYRAPSVVISLCGSYEDSHIRRISGIFSGMEKSGRLTARKCAYSPSCLAKRKSTEQNHICIAFPGLSSTDPDRFALQLLSNILGGGMSSRLFQTVREKYGLCYSIYSFTSAFDGSGLLGIATALGSETGDKALGLIRDELRLLRDEGVTAEELSRACEQVKSNIVMMLESTTSRMNKLGSGELLLGRSLAPDELIAEYDKVTRDDLLCLSRSLLDFDALSVSAVGRVSPAEHYLEKLRA